MEATSRSAHGVGPRVLALALALAAALGGCRATRTVAGGELEGGALLGLRVQGAGWENGSVPVSRLDAAYRPPRWPVGLALSADVTGYFGDDTGEQTASLGVGLARTLALGDGLWRLRLGAGRAFLDTEDDWIFSTESDRWQATYVEAGLCRALGSESGPRLGLEARYADGAGPRLSGTRLDGDILDLYLVLSFGP